MQARRNRKCCGLSSCWQTLCVGNSRNQQLQGNEVNHPPGEQKRVLFVFCRAMAGSAIRDLCRPSGSSNVQLDVQGLTVQANKTKRHGKKSSTLPQKWGSMAGRDGLQQRQEQCSLSHSRRPRKSFQIQIQLSVPQAPKAVSRRATAHSPELFASRVSIHQATLLLQWGLGHYVPPQAFPLNLKYCLESELEERMCHVPSLGLSLGSPSHVPCEDQGTSLSPDFGFDMVLPSMQQSHLFQ